MVCLWTPLHTPLTYPAGANLTLGPVVRSAAKLIRLRKTCRSDSDLTAARLDQ
jgi:hypothetical protein